MASVPIEGPGLGLSADEEGAGAEVLVPVVEVRQVADFVVALPFQIDVRLSKTAKRS